MTESATANSASKAASSGNHSRTAFSDTLLRRIAAEHADAKWPLSPSGAVTSARRHAALKAFASQGVPYRGQDNWQYSNLRPLENVKFVPVTATDDSPAVSAADLPPAIQGYQRYVFVDGKFAPALSGAPGSQISINAFDGEPPFPTPSVADSRFTLLNTAFATDAARIVAREKEHSNCIEVIFVATTPATIGASYPRLEVRAQPRAKVQLIERHLSLGEGAASFVNGAVDISVERGAQVDHYRLQQAGARALWVDTVSANLAEDARYCLHLVNLGADSARSTIHVRLGGANAQLALHSVSVADREQVHDVLAVVEHAAPHTRTEQTFRGIAAGRSQVGFSGKIVVREGAVRSESRQSLRGLLAGPQAEIDVRPQLEIYTDDVKCAHGATAGKLDEAMLFYLLSRGLEPETAQRLLKWAFLEDVVSKIEVAELRRQIELNLAGQLSDAPALQELL